jgi:hypothetical protein
MHAIASVILTTIPYAVSTKPNCCRLLLLVPPL